VSSIAFGANGTWGSCQESRNTYDDQAPPNDFMGPALWPSDLDVFAVAFQDPFGSDLGSHLDMLHASPDCMGMAHYQNNEYFVFDGMNGHMVYYDFAQDHGPGQDDHSDGVIRRFPEVALSRVEGVPGHMEYHEESNRIFIADTGSGRVVAYTVGTGEMERELALINEPLAEYSEYRGAEVAVFASGLQMPSGLAINEDRLFVGDYATGVIYAYDINSGEELGQLDTGSGELTGLEIGPNGTIWFIDSAFGEILRVLP
jgi:outer membrane protein assembly factor BamB